MMNSDNKSGILIIQFDDVLVETQYEMYRSLFTSKLILNKNCTNTKLIQLEDFKNRKNKLFFMDIIKNGLNDSDILDILQNSKFLYDNCIMGNLCKTLLDTAYLEMPQINKVYILIEYNKNTPDTLKIKKDFVNKYFKHSKISILEHDINTPIYDTIKNINWTVFTTDNSYYVQNLAESYKDLTNKEFNIIHRQYNITDQVLDFLIYEKNGTVQRVE